MTDVELAREQLRQEARTYGNRRKINPYTALIQEVQWRAGHVEWIRTELQSQGAAALFTVDHNGNTVDSALMKRYDRERDRLDRVCKLAIDAGIAERYVHLAELHGAVLFQVLQSAFNDPVVALTDQQKVDLESALRRALVAQERELDLDASLEPRFDVPAERGSVFPQ